MDLTTGVITGPEAFNPSSTAEPSGKIFKISNGEA